jgi:hypothetical protein
MARARYQSGSVCLDWLEGVLLPLTFGSAEATLESAASANSVEIVRTRSRIIVLLLCAPKAPRALPVMSSELAIDRLPHHAGVNGVLQRNSL